MILLHESFFTEVRELTWIYKIFTPVRKEFFEQKIEELKKLTDNNTMISINQIIMSQTSNKDDLIDINTEFI